MVITVEICQIVLDITNKKPKNIDIKTSKMTKKKKRIKIVKTYKL